MVTNAAKRKRTKTAEAPTKNTADQCNLGERQKVSSGSGKDEGYDDVEPRPHM